MLAIDVFTVFMLVVVVFIAIVALLFVLIAKGARGAGPSGRSSSLDDPTDTSWFTTRGDDSPGSDFGSSGPGPD
jgi:hypothetical protein